MIENIVRCILPQTAAVLIMLGINQMFSNIPGGIFMAMTVGLMAVFNALFGPNLWDESE